MTISHIVNNIFTSLVGSGFLVENRYIGMHIFLS